MVIDNLLFLSSQWFCSLLFFS